jgi:hypothetical protein
MKGDRDRKSGRVHRTVEHTAHVRRSFDDVAEIVERHAVLVLRAGTEAAGVRSALLVADSSEPSGDFDPHEPLAVVIEGAGSDRHDHRFLEWRWTADREKRLLANVHARLDFQPVIGADRKRTTELRLRADYDPAPGWRHSPDTVLFGRRVVRAALDRMVEQMVVFLEEHEETLELRIDPSPAPVRPESTPEN